MENKSKNDVVIEPNSIAESKDKKMSKAYLDILHIVLHQIANNDDEDPNNLDYDFNVSEYRKKYELSNDTYRKMKRQVRYTMKNDSLMSIRLKDGSISDFFPFQEVIYNEGKGSIHIVLSRRFKFIIEELLKEKGRKVYYALPDTLQMKSAYAKKMYPILLEYFGKPMIFTGSGSLNGKSFDRIDTIENFKEMLSMPKSYVIKNIKDTCHTIVSEIEEYTPYVVNVFFNQISGRGRYGGKTTHVCWTISKKKTNSIPGQIEFEDTTGFDEIVMDMQETTSHSDIDYVVDLIDSYNLGIGSKSTINIAKKAYELNRNEKYIREAIEIAKSQKCNNLGGKIMKFIIDGYADSVKREKKTGFYNFESRKYDYDDLEKKLLGWD